MREQRSDDCASDSTDRASRHAESEELATGTPSGAATEPGPISDTRAGTDAHNATTLSAKAPDLEFYLAVEVHYHRARQAWLAGAHRWLMFLAILFGTAAAGQLFSALSSGLLVAAVGAADLCFDFPGRAAQHSDLARRYLTLARELAAGRNDVDRCGAVLDGLIETSGDAPPVYHAVKDLAHNLAIQSLGRDVKARAMLSFQKRTLAHFWRFDDGT